MSVQRFFGHFFAVITQVDLPVHTAEVVVTRGHLAALGMMPQRNQRIAFGVITSRTTRRDIVRRHPKAIDPAFHPISGNRPCRHHLSRLQPESADIVTVQ